MKVRKIFTLILTFCLGLLATVGLASCGSKDPLESLELKKDFTNKSFINDGIEKVTVGSISDGDTAYFKSGKMSVNVRFYGINTPESTWQIEKWGKAASNFTKAKLKGAKDIVIEGSTTPPQTESTGGRYLGFVWYVPEGGNRYYNLNLEIVLNGYSNQSVEPSHEYYKYFEEAQKIATNKGLGIHSNGVDELFDETLEAATVKDIAANPKSYDQSYVKVPCTIKSQDGSNVVISDVIDGKEYTFPVYLGYLSLGDDRICRPGNRTQFVGRVSSHNGKWQLTGIERELGVADTTKVLTEGYEMSFGLEEENSFYKYGAIYVSSLTTEGDNTIIVGETKNARHDKVTVTLTVPSKFVSGVQVNSKIAAKAYNLTGKGYKVQATEISATVLNATDFRVI